MKKPIFAENIQIMHIIILLFNLLLLLFATCLTAIAQPVQPMIFDNRNSNETGPVYAIDQDETGLNWLATSWGLYTFDGYRFTSRSDVGTMHLYYSIYIVPQTHELLLGGKNGVYCYQRNTGQTVHASGQHATEIRAITSVAHGGENSIVAGGHEGLFRYAGGKLILLTSAAKDIFSIFVSREGLYLGTLRGMFFYKEGRCTRLSVFNKIPSAGAEAISSIERDDQTGHLWIGTFHGLYRYDPATQLLTTTPLSNIVIKHLETYRDGLLISSDDGLYAYSHGYVKHYVHDSRIASSIGNDIIWSARVDKAHNIILATDQGLSVVSNHSIWSMNSLYQLTQMPFGNHIKHVYIDEHHSLWLGGSGGLIHQGHTGVGEGKAHPIVWFRQNDSDHPLPHNQVRCISEDNRHRLWISTDIGIGLYDRDNDRIMPRMIVDSQTGNHVPWIYDMAVDQHGRLWLASTNHALYIVDADELEKTTYLCKTSRKISYDSHGQIGWQIVNDGQQMWVRTDVGLMAVTIDEGKSTTVKEGPIDCITLDHHQHLWVASHDALTEYDRQRKVVRQMALNNAPQQDHIVALSAVGSDLWVVTPSTCSVLSDGKWKAAMHIPGMQATSICYDSRDQCVYLGGDNGVITLPRHWDRNAHARPNGMLLSQLLVNEQPYMDHGRSVIQVHDIQLSHNQNNLSFMLSDMPLTQDVPGLYAYKLEGFDNQWHYTSDLSEAIVYNALPYGDYRFFVNRLNGLGQLDSEVYQLAISISAPWYLSWWAKLLYALIVTMIVVGGVKLYLARRRVMEEQVARQQVMDESQQRIAFYNSLSNRLYSGLEHVMQGLTHLANESNQKTLDEIDWHTTLLNADVRQALDMGQMSERQTSAQGISIDIARYCRNIFERMQPEASRRDIRLATGKLDGNNRYTADIIEWDSVVYILFKSVIQYSEEHASVELSLTPDEGKKLIALSLTSSRFSVIEEMLPHFFQRYTSLSSQSDDLPQDMYRVKEYAEAVNAQIAILKKNNGSVTIQLLLPMSEEVGSRDEAQHPQRIEIDPADEKLMHEITQAIEDHISDSEFNVSKLQETVGIGTKLLYRKTKQNTGMSPVEYIRYVRMKQAALLLSQGKFSISSVMYMVGFSNSGYFSKCFQKVFGVTPTRYRVK